MSSLISSHNPTWVAIQCGSNDILAGSTFASEVSNFNSILSITNAAHKSLVIGEVPPWDSAHAAAITTWNAALHAWGTTNNVSIVYQNSDLNDGSGNLKSAYQGCLTGHLTVAGYQVMGQDFANTITGSTTSTPTYAPVKTGSGFAPVKTGIGFAPVKVN